jgi:hypothetical protein
MQEVRIRVPPDAQAQKVHLLVADKTPEHRVVDGVVTLTVPSVLDHEVMLEQHGILPASIHGAAHKTKHGFQPVSGGQKARHATLSQ